MFRWKSLILVLFVGSGFCANAFGQREVTNFPPQLKDAISKVSSSDAVSKRPWLKESDLTENSSQPKPDPATQAPSPSLKTTEVTPELRKEIEDKIRGELEEKFQAKIEDLFKKQAAQQAKRNVQQGPTLTGEILPLLPAKGYLLTDYTLRQKRAEPRTASRGPVVNFNDTNRRPVTRTLSDGQLSKKAMNKPEPAGEAEPAVSPDDTTETGNFVSPETPSDLPVQTRTVPSLKTTNIEPIQSTQTKLPEPTVTLLPPVPSTPIPNADASSPSELIVPPKTAPAQFANNTVGTNEAASQRNKAVSILEKADTGTSLRSSVIGPEYLAIGSAETFEIIVENLASNSAGEVLVQLSVPDEVTISRLDREAYLDRENRTISWKVPVIQGRSKEVIRYQATSKTAGHHAQSVKLGSNNTLQGVTTFTTVVTNSPTGSIQLPGQSPIPVEVAERPTLEK